MIRTKNQRLANKEILLIKKLTNKSKSLRFISKQLGLNITTIYYQVRKFKPKRQKDFVVNLNDFQIGELIGAFAGDGSYFHKDYDYKGNRTGHYTTRYFLSLKTDEPYANYLAELLTKMNLHPMKFIRKEDNVIHLTVYSKSFIKFIKSYLAWEKDKTLTIRLKDNFFVYSNDFLRGFARGLMDTDGFLNKSNAACACISKHLMSNLSEIFRKFGINHSQKKLKRKGNQRDIYYVRAFKENIDIYEKLIGFSNDFKSRKLKEIVNSDKERLKKPIYHF